MADLVQYVKSMAPDFRGKNQHEMNCEREFHFAVQAIEKNSYLAGVAEKNPNSLRNAILNIAAVGISLNPAEAHAYLVPRDGQVCLDLSYRGLIKLATDSGSIQLAKPELVCTCDEEFLWHDSFTMPTHKFNPFDTERGPGRIWNTLEGGYVVAKLHDGSVLLDRMAAEEIVTVKSASPASAKAGSPWQRWPLEMIKKTLIKRAAKSWPQSQRLSEAIHIDNEASGITFDAEPQPASEERQRLMDQIEQLTHEKAIPMAELCRIAGVSSFAEIADDRLPRVIAYLQKQDDVLEQRPEEASA
jgi:recombination protein RecT